MEAADRAAQLKAGTLCMVISGRAPGETVFNKVLDAVRAVRAKHDLKVCACLGLLNEEQVLRLKEAGVETVNHNLNTSANFTPEIVSTHSFEDRVGTVEAVKRMKQHIHGLEAQHDFKPWRPLFGQSDRARPPWNSMTATAKAGCCRWCA